jgi:uncharacterized protein (TIGR03437 family)
MVIRIAAWVGLLTAGVSAQTIDNRFLNGKYFFRELIVAADAAGNFSDVRSLMGSIVYDGAGRYTFAGQQNIGSAAASAVSGSGVYNVGASGAGTMMDPIRGNLTLNVRAAAGAVAGSTTETSENVFNLFVAVPAPAGPVSNNSLSGAYWAASLEIPAATASLLRSSHFPLQANGLGTFLSFDASGHRADNRGGLPYTEKVSGASYTIGADGSGTAAFPNSTLLAAGKVMYLSKDGNFLLGGSTAAGAHDFFLAVKQAGGSLSNASWRDKFWSAGIRFEGKTPSAYAGSANADGAGTLVWSQRVRQAGSAAIDFSGAVQYTLSTDGDGRMLAAWIGLGAGGDGFLGTTAAPEAASTYDLSFGVRLPPAGGSGVFLNPQGVLNSASFAPPGNPVSPGQFVALFGSNLATATAVAQSSTFPAVLSGVSVSVNGRPAPIYFVSPGQISCLVPFGVTGATATIQVNNNGTRSNAVDVPLAATAPGIFTQSQRGYGVGAMQKVRDFSLITAANPVRRNDAIVVYLTGLGAVSPAVADGAPGPSAEPLARTTQTPKVYIGGKAATVLYSGLAPGYPGLYQINVVVPAAAPFGAKVPLAVETVEHFHDQVDLPVVP